MTGEACRKSSHWWLAEIAYLINYWLSMISCKYRGTIFPQSIPEVKMFEYVSRRDLHLPLQAQNCWVQPLLWSQSPNFAQRVGITQAKCYTYPTLLHSLGLMWHTGVGSADLQMWKSPLMFQNLRHDAWSWKILPLQLPKANWAPLNFCLWGEGVPTGPQYYGQTHVHNNNEVLHHK